MATLIREAVDRMLVDDVETRWTQALQACGKFRSGHSDVSVEHDRYLAEDFAE